jgi:serine phosphatase RsbU (regulator of sigma subunit)
VSVELFGRVTRALPNPVLLARTDGLILAVNPAASRIPALAPGADLLELIVGPAPLLGVQMRRWAGSGDPLPGTLTLHDAAGRAVRYRCHGARAAWWPGPGVAVQLHLTQVDYADQFAQLSEQVEMLARESAYRRRLEAEQDRLLAAEQSSRARFQTLYRLTAALAAAGTLAQVAAAVADTAPAALGAQAVSLQLYPRQLLPALRPAEPPAPLAHVAWIGPGDEPAPQQDAEHTVRVPLKVAGEQLGTLQVRHHDPDAHIEHLTAVAQQIGQALWRAGLYENEHRVSETLQLSLLPRLDPVPGLATATGYAPGVDAARVGGDWYDLYRIDQGRIGLSVGDVAGHGITEAGVMAHIVASLRSSVLRCGKRPGAVLRELNEFLRLYHDGQMATGAYLLLDPATGSLRYSVAGHPPPLVIQPDGTSSFLRSGRGPLLGAFPQGTYPQARTRLAPGDTLLLYTDGLIERRGEDLDTGFARLRDLARATVGLSVREICALFLHHRPADQFDDDRAILVLRQPCPQSADVSSAP